MQRDRSGDARSEGNHIRAGESIAARDGFPQSAINSAADAIVVIVQRRDHMRRKAALNRIGASFIRTDIRAVTARRIRN